MSSKYIKPNPLHEKPKHKNTKPLFGSKRLRIPEKLHDQVVEGLEILKNELENKEEGE